MAAQSKLMEAAINCSCRDYLHPWTSSCVAGSAGIMLCTIPSALRTYSYVYVFAMIMRMRIPTMLDLKRTIIGILKSTAFLTTNAYGFSLLTCVLRALLGRFYFGTIAFLPTFLASVVSLLIERPERRVPLALYVSNVASEAAWNMLKARGLVRSIPNGQVLLLGSALTALLYMYRLGVHKTKVPDGAFKAVKFIMGTAEEGPIKTPEGCQSQNSPRQPIVLTSIQDYVRFYDRMMKTKHHSCPHSEGCAPYILIGALKTLVGGVGAQMGLKLLLGIPKIIKNKLDWQKQIFCRSNLNLGLALSSFSLIYKFISCGLRNSCGHDSALFSVPAGLLGSIGLLQFPNITVAMYVLWKTLQLIYKWGIAEGILPQAPHFTMIMYSICTALLFHCAIVEPNSLRASYYKFLMDISGNRLCRFDMSAFDAYGLGSQSQVHDTIKRLKIDLEKQVLKLPLVV